MSHGKIFNQIIATILIVAVFSFIIYALWPYANGIFGAIILYVLFRPIYDYLTLKKGLSSSLSAAIILIISFLIILIPFSFAINSLISQLGSSMYADSTITTITTNLEEMFPETDISGPIDELITKATNYISNTLISAVSNVTKIVITWIIMYFLLYYMLVNNKFVSRKSREFIPFSTKNQKRIINEFKRVTKSTVITTGLIALLEGILLGVGFAIFGIEGAVFWGFLGFIFSLLPVVGVFIIWIPASINQLFIEQNIVAGVGIIIWGTIVGMSDYFIRPYLQKKFGEIHPIVTLIGIFIGLPLFGIIGLILGPLLLSYASLLTRMYLDEYIH
ncbi:MAG: AI-2E family transporter [Nanoarchaeota archaeon]